MDHADRFFGDRCFFELAEARAEGDQRGVVERLVAEHEDLVLQPRVGDFAQRCLVERERHINAADFRAQRTERAFYPDGHRYAPYLISFSCFRITVSPRACSASISAMAARVIVPSSVALSLR